MMPINNLNAQSYKKSRIDLRLASALKDCVVSMELGKMIMLENAPSHYITAMQKAASTLVAYEKGEHRNAGQHPTSPSYRKPKR